MHLVRVVAAAIEAPDVLVAHARHHLGDLRVLAEKVLAHERAVVRLVVLVFAVDRLLHHAQQAPFLVAREQRIPVRSPDHLDHVPAGAAELALELLDDLAVAAHRAVEPLQVAVDDEDQVVELLARGEADGAERLGLVHFAVAAKHPHLAIRRLCEAARLEILEVARHVDPLDRAESHRHRGELPVVGHQPGMRIGRDTLAVDLAAEIDHSVFGQSSFEERASIDARRRVSLEVDQVAAVSIMRRVPEVLLARAEQRADRSEARDVAAELVVALVRLRDHHHRVPTADGTDALLERHVARRALLHMRRNRVDVRSVRRERDVGARAARLVDQPLDQVVRAVRAFALEHRFERIEPFLRLERVGVVGGGRLRNGGHGLGIRICASGVCCGGRGQA